MTTEKRTEELGTLTKILNTERAEVLLKRAGHLSVDPIVWKIAAVLMCSPQKPSTSTCLAAAAGLKDSTSGRFLFCLFQTWQAFCIIDDNQQEFWLSGAAAALESLLSKLPEEE